MNIVLINWSEGENDPFSLFNQCLAEHFLANGRHTITVQLDSDFAKNMRVALDMGVDFAMTWQGLGSNLKAHESAGTTIWDDLKVPLVCLSPLPRDFQPHRHLRVRLSLICGREFC